MPSSQVIFSGTITETTVATVYQTLPASQDWVSVVLNITAVSGDSASALFSIQWSTDGGTWADASPVADQFDPITAPCTIVQRFPAKAGYWRAVCQLTGTDPAFTGSANSYS